MTAGISENDVLHAETSNLERFGDTFSGEEAETILSALTVQYIRIPVITHFFADLQVGSIDRRPCPSFLNLGGSCTSWREALRI